MKCHDCKKEIPEPKRLILIYEDNGEEIEIHKCEDCYKESEELTNFRECEVYTRIVGYLRPKSQSNPGKVQEIKERKYYKI